MLSAEWSWGGDADPTTLILQTPGVRKIIDITSIVRDGRRHLWCLADNAALPSLIRLNESLQDWARSAKVDIQWHGVAAQLAEVSSILTNTAAVSLPTMGLVAGAVVGLQCHSVLWGLASIWVNFLPVCILVLIATAFGWSVDMPSLMIGAIAVGMAVDDTIHIASSFMRTNSMFQSVEECFRPSAGSSLVAAACLSCFAISEFSPVRQFGMLLAAAAIAALLANLVLLPALWWKPGVTSSVAVGLPE
jgi:predicted RND superfamily exporter protein